MTPMSPRLTKMMTRIQKSMTTSLRKPLGIAKKRKASTAREASAPMVKTRRPLQSPVRLAMEKTPSLIVRSIGGLVSEELLSISRPFPAWTSNAAEPLFTRNPGIGNYPASFEKVSGTIRILLNLVTPESRSLSRVRPRRADHDLHLRPLPLPKTPLAPLIGGDCLKMSPEEPRKVLLLMMMEKCSRVKQVRGVPCAPTITV